MRSPETTEYFRRDGYLTRIRILDPERARQVRGCFDALESREGRDQCRIGLIDRHFDTEFIREMACHPVILDCIESLIGPDILLLATHFFCKYGPDQEKFVAWHQDVTYWALDPPFAVTAWYAVDDSDRENGCMRVIPGTHAAGIREHGKSQQVGNLLSINQEVPVTPEEEARAVDLELRAGEMSIHHGTLIHGSLPNRSSRRRCGLTLRYIPAWVKQVGINSQGRRWNAVQVRGTHPPAAAGGGEAMRTGRFCT